MIELSLPWPPTGNTYWRRHQGRVLISRDGRAYQRRVRDEILVQQIPAITDQNSRLGVEVLAFPPDRRHRDIDNLLKALLDAMQKGGLFPDDNQIDDLRICRKGPEKPGRVQVHIKPLTEGEANGGASRG